MPSTLKEICLTAFKDCDSLKKMNLPINVKLLSSDIRYIKSLEEVKVEYTNFDELYSFDERVNQIFGQN